MTKFKYFKICLLISLFPILDKLIKTYNIKVDINLFDKYE